MLSAASIVLALSALGMVSAHGLVESVVVGGVETLGYNPYSDAYKNPVPDRPQRVLPGNGPIEDVTGKAIQCGADSLPAALTVPVAAGETVGFKWTAWPDSHKGPVITYLARVPEGKTAATWDMSDAQFFKIDEAGYDATTKKWAGTDILTGEKNSVWDVKIPAGLKAGEYVARHEIVALHAAGSYPGAQFYPNCYQLEVTGSGTALPTKGLVSFPGAYTATTPGVAFGIYGEISSYPIPGPAVWDGVSDTIGDGSSAPAPAPAPSSSAAPAPTTAAPEPTTAAPEPTSAAEEPAPTTSAAEEPVPTTSAAEEPVPTTSAAEEPAPTTVVEEPVPTTVVEEPVSTSVAAPAPVSTTSAVVTSAPAPTAAPGPVTDANECYRSYNKCLDKTQPKPDFTGCSADRDQCLTGARYNRLRRSAHIGRRAF